MSTPATQDSTDDVKEDPGESGGGLSQAQLVTLFGMVGVLRQKVEHLGQQVTRLETALAAR